MLTNAIETDLFKLLKQVFTGTSFTRRSDLSTRQAAQNMDRFLETR